MKNRRLWVLRSYVLTFLFVGFWCIDSSGQYDLQFQGPEKIDWCQSATYDFRLDRFSDSPVEDLMLNIVFDHDVAYVSNSLGLLITPVDSRTITLDLNDFEQCGYLAGSIEVFPACSSSLVTLGSTATLMNGSEMLHSQLTSALVGATTMQMAFGPYSYDGTNGRLTKTITVTNVNTSTIQSFDIILSYSEAFATLSMTSLGAISDVNQITISPSDLPNGSLEPLESLEITLVHDLLACDIEFVSYDIVFNCELGDCNISYSYPDDNEVDRTILEVVGIDQIEQEPSPFNPTQSSLALNYGICAPVYNPIVIKHQELDYSGTLADAYDVSFVYDFDDSRAGFYKDCIDPTFLISGTEITYDNFEPYKYLVSFGSITQDLDGSGGLQDLDGDGFYDDIARGDSVVVDIGILSIAECDASIRGIQGTIKTSAADLCGESTLSFTKEATIKDRHDISAVSWKDLPKDAVGDRYYSIGDTVLWELNYQYSENIDPLCDNTDMEVNIVIPPSLIWIEEDAVLIKKVDSTKVLLPVIKKEDSVLIVSFEGSSSAYIQFRFIATCPEDPIENFNPDIPIEEQCIEWNTYNLLATIDNQCGDDCDRFIATSPTLSTTFRTLCEEEEVYQNVLTVEPFVINRMNGGWMDSAQAVRWDPELYRESPNQRMFYDHDTMRIQIPFVFNNVGLLDALRLTIGNRLNQQEVDLEMFGSRLLIYNRTTGSLLDQCDVSIYTTDGSRDITLFLNREDFDFLCFSEIDSLVWELLITPNVERSERLERNSFIEEDIRLIAEERVGSCFERIYNIESSYYISEVFNPRLLRIGSIEGFSQFDFSLDDIRMIGLSINSGFLGNQSPIVDYETRFPVRLSDFQLEIPKGYELVDSSFQLLSMYSSFNPFDPNTYVDTLFIISPLSNLETDSSTLYSYRLPLDVVAPSAIEQDLFIGINIRSVCPPETEQETIRISGFLEYDDYYGGSLRSLPLSFNLTDVFQFEANDISFEDDFVISKGGSIEWQLNNNKQPSFLDFRGGRRIPWILEYSSSHIIIDSIIAFSRSGFSRVQLTKLENYFIEQVEEKRFLIQETQSNNDLFPLDLSGLKIYTSQQDCGYDTITIRYGQESLWEDGLCPEAIFEDQLIIYTPVGLPQTRWIRYPEFIDLCDTSWFRWELNNIGEGGLTESQLKILSVEVQNPQLQVTIDSLTYLLNDADLNYTNGAYEIDLSDIGIDTLNGLIDANRRNILMDWYWTPDCDSPNLYDVDIKVHAKTSCDEEVISRGIPLNDIPLRTLQDSAYSISMNSVSGPVCGDTVMMRVEIGSMSAQELTNDSLLVYLPREYSFYVGSARANDVQITDPSISYEGNFQILSWINAVRFSDDQPFVLEFLLDGACGDICGRGEGRAILMSRVQTSCNSLVCERYTSRAATPLENHFWRPKMELDITSFEVLSIQNAMMRAVVTWDLSQIRNHIYDGQIQAHYYRDSDGNNLINFDEEILETSTIYFDSSQQVIITDTIKIIVSNACELSLFIELERDCACFTTAESIGMLERVSTRQEVVLCATEVYEIEKGSIEECRRTWNAHPRMDISDIGLATYNPALTPDFVGRDTIVGLLDCDDCDFIDSIFFDVYKLEPIIVLDKAACNGVGATVSVMIDHLDPSALTYSWNIMDSGNRPTIDNILLGLVEVVVSDNQGCSAVSSLLIEPEEIAYEVNILGDRCDSISGQSIEIVLTGSSDSISVIWADGSEGTLREELSSGSYPFEINSADGCFVKDTVFLSSSNLTGINYQDAYTVDLGQELSIAPIEVVDHNVTFSWEPSALVDCDSCQEIVITPMNQAELSVTIMDLIGCSKTETITINVESKLSLYLPNVISRYGDPSNTRLFPSEHPSVDQILTYRVFDRWGNAVVDKENLDPRDASQGWNGTYGNQQASPGVYVYDIVIRMIDGTEQRFTSSVTLIP